MSGEPEDKQGSLDIDRPGDRLRRAREAAGLDLKTVALQTRVTTRHLESIEANDFGALPSTTYAVGFSRAYARAVGLDEAEIAQEVRTELETSGLRAPRTEIYEPADLSQVPPRRLAWTAAAIALMLALGYGIWRSQVSTPPTDAEVAAQAARPAAAPPRPTVSKPATGPVVLTAAQPVWLRIYDADGTRLLEKEMAAGESFTVPDAANNPMILTGRPEALAVTVGGRAVPPLGPPEKTIADLPISAAALLARPTVTPTPAVPSTVAPTTPSAPPTPARRQVPPAPAAIPPAQPASAPPSPSPAAAPAD